MPAACQRAARRVLVTGIGIVSPLGVDTLSTWTALLAGRCGVDRVRAFDASHLPSRIAAEVDRAAFDAAYEREVLAPLDAAWQRQRSERQADAIGLGPADAKSAPDFIRFSLSAAQQALADAHYVPRLQPRSQLERAAVVIGAGMASVQDVVDTAVQLHRGSEARAQEQQQLPRQRHGAGAGYGYRRVSPYFVPRILVNSAAGFVSMAHGFRGPNCAPATACAAGAHAIGDAYRMIQRGDAEVALAGGSESCVNEIAMAGFARAKALATSFNEAPHAASRPFDARREGFVLGEGAAVLMLEEREHARRRGVRIDGEVGDGGPSSYGEVVGFGMSGEAYHVTAPRPDGDGARRCMQMALRDVMASRGAASASALAPVVAYVNAHATSTPLGDRAEAHAIRRVFHHRDGDEREAAAAAAAADDALWLPALRQPPHPLISSTKGATGHLLGAAGAIEAAFSLLALRYNRVPPTLNFERAAADDDLPSELRIVGARSAAERDAHAADTLSRLFDNGGARAGDDAHGDAERTAATVPVLAMSNSFGFGGTNTSLAFQRGVDGGRARAVGA